MPLRSGIGVVSDESVPYPKKYESFYAKSKAMGEKLVIEANNQYKKNIEQQFLESVQSVSNHDTQVISNFMDNFVLIQNKNHQIKKK